MGRSFYIATSIIGFLSGVLLHLVFQPGLTLLLAAAFLYFLLAVLARGKALGFILLLLFVVLGLIRSELSVHRSDFNQIDYYNGYEVGFEGVVVETDIRRTKAKYTVRLDRAGEVLVTLNKYPTFDYGDRLYVMGELQEPIEFEDFSYKNYLSRFGIYSVMYYPQVRLIEKGQGNFFWTGMTFLQNKFMERINKIFPEPHASFEAGLLVGARKGIPDDLIF